MFRQSRGFTRHFLERNAENFHETQKLPRLYFRETRCSSRNIIVFFCDRSSVVRDFSFAKETTLVVLSLYYNLTYILTRYCVIRFSTPVKVIG